jgi:hypothetical protein
MTEPRRNIKLSYTQPYLYPKQKAAIFDPARISVIEASTKSGKTSGCIVWLLEQAFAGKSGQNFWWVAPISRVARIAFTRAMRAMNKDLFVANLGDHTLTLVNGAIVWFLGADNPDSLFGEDVHAAVIDEASRMKASAFHAIYTTLTATRGSLRIIGNVKGRQNWFHEKARYAQQGKDPEYAYHKIISHDAIEAHVLTEDTVEAAKRSLPDSVFRELYLAEASDDQGNPFGIEAIRKCIGPMSTAKPEVWGWDLAKSHDWTVGIGLDSEGRVCRFERWQSPWEATHLRITGLTNKVRALVDSTGVGDPIVERLQKVVGSKYEGYKFTAGSKQQLMEGLAVAIQTKAITFPPGPIVEELEVFEYTYTGHGASRNVNDEEFEPKGHGIRYCAPDGYDDDCVMALALAVYHRSHSVPRLHVTKDIVARSRLRVMGNQGFHISQMGRW